MTQKQGENERAFLQSLRNLKVDYFRTPTDRPGNPPASK